MKYGYIRVSTEGQNEDRQIDALEAICDEMDIERVSAVSQNRPVYDAVVEKLSEGDTFVILDLDRAFRSVVDAVSEAEKLRQRGIGMKIVNLNIDTATPAGELVYTMMAAAAQFERKLLIQRINEGLAAARKRGVKLGRPSKLSPEDLEHARLLLKQPQNTLRSIAPSFRVHWKTLSKALRTDEL